MANRYLLQCSCYSISNPSQVTTVYSAVMELFSIHCLISGPILRSSLAFFSLFVRIYIGRTTSILLQVSFFILDSPAFAATQEIKHYAAFCTLLFVSKDFHRQNHISLASSFFFIFHQTVQHSLLYRCLNIIQQSLHFSSFLSLIIARRTSLLLHL